MFEYSEKRDFMRMSMDCPARYRIEGTQELGSAVVKDLSGGGVSLVTEQPLAADDRIALEVMPGKSITPPLSAWVRVIRCEQNGDGNYSVACKLEQILDENEIGPDFP